jgi:GT2 family glycosyltransferase
VVDVDVGVLTFNTADLSVKALRHLLDVDQGCRLRLLVRDNASSDGTADAIRREVPEAELDAGDVNLGFAAGVNTLLARSTAPWFFALNSDAWPTPGAIGQLVKTAEANPRAALVVPRIERPDGALEYSTHPFPSPKIAAATTFSVWRWRGPQVASDMLLDGYWKHDVERDVDWAVGAAWLLRRPAIEQLGGLDERFFMYAEDMEWCWRAAKRGWTVRFDPAALVVHVGNASGKSAYGRHRTLAFLQNSYRFYRGEHSAIDTAAYRLLSLAGSSRLYLRARRRRDTLSARLWADHVRAHLRPIPTTDTSRPVAERRPS